MYFNNNIWTTLQILVHRYFAHSNDKLEDERTIEFYDTVRLDGLSKLRMNPESLIVDYMNREDSLEKW